MRHGHSLERCASRSQACCFVELAARLSRPSPMYLHSLALLLCMSPLPFFFSFLMSSVPFSRRPVAAFVVPADFLVIATHAHSMPFQLLRGRSGRELAVRAGHCTSPDSVRRRPSRCSCDCSSSARRFLPTCIAVARTAELPPPHIARPAALRPGPPSSWCASVSVLSRAEQAADGQSDRLHARSPPHWTASSPTRPTTMSSLSSRAPATASSTAHACERPMRSS